MKEIKSGVYQIRNIINNKRYIGSSENIHNRFVRHRNDLRKNRNHNILLQRAWNKYGEENFVFEIIENCEKSKLIEREQYYLDTLKPEYNLVDIAGKPKGYKHTEEAKRKISLANYGRKFTDEHRKNLSISSKGKNKGKEPWIKGKKQSEECKKKISKTLSDGRMKGKNNGMYGRKHSEESKKKMSLSQQKPRLWGRKFKEENIWKLQEMIDENFSILEIAAHFNCSAVTVYRELKRLKQKEIN